VRTAAFLFKLVGVVDLVLGEVDDDVVDPDGFVRRSRRR